MLRESRDQFASSESVSEVYDVETGGTSTRRVYTVTNDGERSYRGLSLEYVREFGRDHALSFSTNWSHTDATNISYFDISDETEFEGEYVYYQGEVVPKAKPAAASMAQAVIVSAGRVNRRARFSQACASNAPVRNSRPSAVRP